MKTVVVNVGGLACTAEVIDQRGDVIDVRNLGKGWTTIHNLLPEDIARDGEPSYRADSIKEVEPQPEAPKPKPWAKGKPIELD